MVMAPHPPLSALDPHSAVRLFPDDEFRIVNADDTSKQLAFDLSALTTGTTRTLTFPDASGTVALLERAGQSFTKAVTFALGLTVAGAAFASRGIQDDATARALTLSGSGANSITIANSATDPTIGTTAGALKLNPYSGATVMATGANVSIHYCQNTANASGAWFGVDASGHGYAWNANAAAGISNFYLGNGSVNNTGGVYIYAQGVPQVVIPAVSAANRYITLTGSNGAGPIISTSGGALELRSATGVIQSTSTNAGGGKSFFMSNTSATAGTYSQIGTTSNAGSIVIQKDCTASGGASYIYASGSGAFSIYTNTAQNLVLGADTGFAFIVLPSSGATRQVTVTGNTGNPKLAVTAGSLDLGSPVVLTAQTVGTTVGAAGGASALPATPLGYLTTSINGTACKIPYYN